MKGTVKRATSTITLSSLRAAGPAACRELGCTDTLREILHQPDTWRATAERVRGMVDGSVLAAVLEPMPRYVVLTGSGSSLYVGECLAPVLQERLGVPCRAVGAGTILSQRAAVLPRGGGLLISLARSGDSPESTGVVDSVLAEAPEWRHLVVTCNAEGGLATRYRGEPRLRVLLLDADTNDRSLVMTSSFTNLLLATGCLLREGRDAASVVALVDTLFEQYGDTLAEWGARNHDAAVYLGSGANWGAAREAALKMLEMSAGAVRVMAETSLGLRHGPMAWFNRDSLLVSFLSGHAEVRGYETDLLRELTRKNLARARIVVGEHVDPEWVGRNGVALDLPGLYGLPPVHQAMLHVVVGQLLALFRCLAEDQRPDAPSPGVLTRVVEAFSLHGDRSP